MTKEAYRDYQRKYYHEHREKMLARSKAYKQKNKEAWNAYVREWRKKNPKKQKAIIERYKESHSEELKIQRHKYYLKKTAGRKSK